jgi:hypothetical protein
MEAENVRRDKFRDGIKNLLESQLEDAKKAKKKGDDFGMIDTQSISRDGVLQALPKHSQHLRALCL